MKVQVLKPFASRGKEYLPGPADVPDADVARLASKGFVTAPEAGAIQQESVTSPMPEGDGAEGAATYISATFGIERSSDEPAAAFVERIIHERNELRAELERNNQSFNTAWDGVQGQLGELRAARDRAEEQMAKANEQLATLQAASTAPADEAAATEVTGTGETGKATETGDKPKGRRS